MVAGKIKKTRAFENVPSGFQALSDWLLEHIWDSIAAEASNAVELLKAQKAELHRRVAAHRADPSSAVPWEQVRSKLFPSKP